MPGVAGEMRHRREVWRAVRRRGEALALALLDEATLVRGRGAGDAPVDGPGAGGVPLGRAEDELFRRKRLRGEGGRTTMGGKSA